MKLKKYIYKYKIKKTNNKKLTTKNYIIEQNRI